MASFPRLTPSPDLPDNLILAGEDGCAPGADHTFSACSAGHGQWVVKFHDSTVNGTYHSSFGIDRIVSHDDPGYIVNWVVTVHLCIPNPLDPGDTCVFQTTQDVPVQVPAASAAPAGRASVIAPTIDVPLFGPIDKTFLGFHEQGEFSLWQVGVHLQGESDRILGGSDLADPVALDALPAKCQSLSGSAELFSHAATPRSVTFPLGPITLTGCPTAVFGLTAITGTRATFDGSASTTPLGPDRTVARYHWRFGDGRTRVTTTPTVQHLYPAAPLTPPAYAVRLVVEDSAGALSHAATLTVNGTAMSMLVSKVDNNTKIKAVGGVSPSEAGRDVTVRLFRKPSGGVFHLVTSVTKTLNGSSRFAALFPRPAAGQCKVVARFGGESTHLGSSVTKLTTC